MRSWVHGFFLFVVYSALLWPRARVYRHNKSTTAEERLWMRKRVTNLVVEKPRHQDGGEKEANIVRMRFKID